jgi:hypothetical protein
VHRNKNRRLRHRLCIGRRNTGEHHDIKYLGNLRKLTMIPSLGGIGLFKGKMITLCGRLTHVPMSAHGTSIEEGFKVIKFVENNAPFSLLLGRTWIERD